MLQTFQSPEVAGVFDKEPTEELEEEELVTEGLSENDLNIVN